MDPIPFKKVSLEEARAALKDGPAATPPAATGKWQRRAPSLHDQELTRTTFDWLSKFARGIRPEALARTFPRIANRLAELWKHPAQCERYLDDLLLDNRGGRKGFPADVAAEITALKLHFMTNVSPPRLDVWGHPRR